MKVYLIDSANNNKVVNFFDSKKEAEAHILNKYYNSNLNESFKEFRENFYFVPKNELEEKARKNGKRIYEYYN